MSDGRIRSVNLHAKAGYAMGQYRRDDGSTGRYEAPIPSEEGAELLDLLVSGRVPTEVDHLPGKQVSLLPVLLTALLLLVLITAMLRSRLAWRGPGSGGRVP